MFKIPKGNDFWLRMNVELIEWQSNGKVSLPYELATAQKVSALASNWQYAFPLAVSFNGSMLTLKGKGSSFGTGRYKLEVNIIDEDGRRLHYHADNVFIVVNDTARCCMLDGSNAYPSVFDIGSIGVYTGINEAYFDRFDAIMQSIERHEQECINRNAEYEDNENTRKANEEIRKENETARRANEETRQANEDERQANTAKAISDCEEATAAAWTKEAFVNISFESADCIIEVETAQFSSITFEEKEDCILELNY